MTAHTLRAKFKEAVSEAILEAAEQVAAEIGLSSVSLQAIAQRAGVAVGTIYNHFADRNELFVELFARRRQEMLVAVDAAYKKTAGASFEVQLETYVRSVLAHFDTRRPFLRLALDAQAPKLPSKSSDPTAQASMTQLRARAERVVKVGIKEKRLKTEGADLFAVFLMAAIKGVLIARVDGENPLADDAHHVVALFLHGVAK